MYECKLYSEKWTTSVEWTHCLTPILSMLANTLFSIAADKMQSAAKDHIMKAIDENLDDDAKKVLDQAISDDKGHNKNSLSDLLG